MEGEVVAEPQVLNRAVHQTLHALIYGIQILGFDLQGHLDSPSSCLVGCGDNAAETGLRDDVLIPRADDFAGPLNGVEGLQPHILHRGKVCGNAARIVCLHQVCPNLQEHEPPHIGEHILVRCVRILGGIVGYLTVEEPDERVLIQAELKLFQIGELQEGDKQPGQRWDHIRDGVVCFNGERLVHGKRDPVIPAPVFVVGFRVGADSPQLIHINASLRGVDDFAAGYGGSGRDNAGEILPVVVEQTVRELTHVRSRLGEIHHVKSQGVLRYVVISNNLHPV